MKMNKTQRASLIKLISSNRENIVADWTRLQMKTINLRSDLMTESELQEQSVGLMDIIIRNLKLSKDFNIYSDDWLQTRQFLKEISESRARQGFSPTETATFVFSLKQPLNSVFTKSDSLDTQVVVDLQWSTTTLIDQMGLYTMEIYNETREKVILAQSEEILDLSTPVIKLWPGVLAIPVIGTLDSVRTQQLMETLLDEIDRTQSEIAIIDITGVPNVDTMVAQYLIKTISAARLMGAECIVSGIRPAIANTMVTLGIDLDVLSKSNMSDALAEALKLSGWTFQRTGK